MPVERTEQNGFRRMLKTKVMMRIISNGFPTRGMLAMHMTFSKIYLKAIYTTVWPDSLGVGVSGYMHYYTPRV